MLITRLRRRIRTFRLRRHMPPGGRSLPGDVELAEYVRYLARPRRQLWLNFIAGLARGVGMAIGFSVLGAVFIYFLQRLAYEKLPVIGDFIAELMAIVESQSRS